MSVFSKQELKEMLGESAEVNRVEKFIKESVQINEGKGDPLHWSHIKRIREANPDLGLPADLDVRSGGNNSHFIHNGKHYTVANLGNGIAKESTPGDMRDSPYEKAKDGYSLIKHYGIHDSEEITLSPIAEKLKKAAERGRARGARKADKFNTEPSKAIDDGVDKVVKVKED